MNEIRGMETSKRSAFSSFCFNSSIDKERKMSEFRGHKAVKRKNGKRVTDNRAEIIQRSCKTAFTGDE